MIDRVSHVLVIIKDEVTAESQMADSRNEDFRLTQVGHL